MRQEYDFSKGERGKFAKRYREGTNIVVLDPELRKSFPNDEAVNEALREYLEIEEEACDGGRLTPACSYRPCNCDDPLTMAREHLQRA
ncbi:MAG: hypothetical protein U5Q16_07615 [Gammaproteobacteria bacterium]|nr:hypothetical protein [Gammaproteobacteria bacterium]